MSRKHAINTYITQDGEWLDGKRADVLLVPINSISESMPPVLIEVQNVVDREYIHRINKYCNNIYDQYKTEPIVLTICIKETRAELTKMFSDSNKGSYLKTLPSKFWAKEHLIMTPSTIDDYLRDYRDHGDCNNNIEPLPPLLALGYVLTEQKCSLFGLQYKDDPTVIQLYTISKEAMEHHIQEHRSTVERLVDVASVTQKQFKRTLEVTNEDKSDTKKAQTLANVGVLYTETCLQKYTHQFSGESSTMTTPLDLQPSVHLPRNSTNDDILAPAPTNPPLDDMKYARQFKEEYLKTHKQMSWKACYEQGVSEGYFRNYKSYIILVVGRPRFC